MTPLVSPVNVAQPVLALAELEPGETATVVAVDVPGEIGERLMEMGLTPGTQVTFVRRGLWGDPIQIRLRGFMLTLRRAQAREIRVTR
ncbi:MAG: ferrous iron transport protein A [Clostridia bacterium]|nr:ferrous iron transport protein A [Deltaproteobacteria bacterium]